MARVTVEDCIDKIPNRFEIVMLAGHRARALSKGAPLLVERDEDKNPVVALREIAEEKLTVAALREDAIESQQKHLEVDEPVEDGMAMRMGETADVPSENEMNEDAFLKALKGV